MEIIQAILGDRNLMLAVGTMIVTPVGYLAVWYFFRTSRRKEMKQETAPVQHVPLDTSYMLSIPMSQEDREVCMDDAGTFGSRYVHMLVTDRDGQRYFCLMTEYNLRALWTAGFRQGRVEPLLSERHEDFEIDGVQFGSYPAFLRGYRRSDPLWIRWVNLNRNFNSFIALGGDYWRSHQKYFQYGEPRPSPLEETQPARA